MKEKAIAIITARGGSKRIPKKNIRELLQMPFSRHWIMHIEACEAICKKIIKIV